LKLSTRLVSGEDSITNSGALEVEPVAELEAVLDEVAPAAVVLDELEEQAARPAARRPAAPSASALLLVILLIVNFDLSSRVLRFRGEVVFFWGLDGADRD
jgi:hypothetical protein